MKNWQHCHLQLQLGAGRHHCESSSSSSKPIYDNNMEYVKQPNHFSSIEHMHEKLSRQPNHTNHQHVTGTLLMISASNNPDFLIDFEQSSCGNNRVGHSGGNEFDDEDYLVSSSLSGSAINNSPKQTVYTHCTIAEHTRITLLWHYFRPLLVY